jgi:hypothetical protein
MIRNMFRASLCSSSGGQLYIYSIWYRPTLYAAIQCTDQERTMMHGQKTIKVLHKATPLLFACALYSNGNQVSRQTDF